MKRLIVLFLIIGLTQWAHSMECAKEGADSGAVPLSYQQYIKELPVKAPHALSWIVKTQIAIFEKLGEERIREAGNFLEASLAEKILPWVVKKSKTEEGKASIENYITNFQSKWVLADDSIFPFLCYLRTTDDSNPNNSNPIFPYCNLL